MLKQKTILLTGGTGFLGSNLLRQLVGNYKVILATRTSSNAWRINSFLDKVCLVDINKTSLEGVFNKEKIDIIIHCATNYGRKESDPLAILEANLILPLKLLQLGSRSEVSCFINTDTVLDKRVNYYSLSKSQFKEWLKAYSDQMACVNVALEHFYGPNDNESKFVTFIIRSILNKVEKIDLTEGKQKRDFIFIDDVVDAFMRIITHGATLSKGYFNYEIGTDCNVSIRKFVTLAKELAGNKETILNFNVLPYRENEVMESAVDITEIKKLGWQSKFSLEKGLKETIKHERAGL